MSDAAFAAALEAYKFALALRWSRKDTDDEDAARAEVLRLYAERQGEEYFVEEVYANGGYPVAFRYIPVPFEDFPHGQRVRVAKVEEGQ